MLVVLRWADCGPDSPLVLHAGAGGTHTRALMQPCAPTALRGLFCWGTAWAVLQLCTACAHTMAGRAYTGWCKICCRCVGQHCKDSVPVQIYDASVL